MNLSGRPELAVPVFSRKSEAGVLDKKGVEPEISRHAHGGFHGIVGDDACDDQQTLLCPAQPGFEIGAYECAVSPLGDYGLAGDRLHFRLELISRLAGTIMRVGLGGIVTNVVVGAVRAPPCFE